MSQEVVHSTPTSAAWLNQFERWFAELTSKEIARRVHGSAAALENDIAAFVEAQIENPKPCNRSRHGGVVMVNRPWAA